MSKNTHEDNPNLDAKELTEPFLFLDEDGKALKEPMVFYNNKLDLNLPLPKISPLGAEYYMNWAEVERDLDRKVFPLDFLNKKDIVFKLDKNEVLPSQLNSATITEKINIKQDDISPKERRAERDVSYSAYGLMGYFRKRCKVVTIKNIFYAYEEFSYLAKSHIEIARLIMKYCREHLEDKSSSFLDGIVNFLMREPQICVQQQDIPKNYVSFKNGVLDTTTRLFLKHSSSFLTLYYIDANYSPFSNLETPIFDNFINSITGGDLILAERILQFIGYALTPDSNAKCLFLLQGVGDSGKSVFANFLQKLFNDDSVVQLEAEFFGEKFTTAELIGKALCYMPDIPPSPLDNSSVSRLKLITGNDRLKVHKKNEGNSDLITSAKFIIATNHALLTKTKDEPFFNRVITIPFRFAIPREERIVNLEELLLQEKDAVVTKAVSAYFRLVDNGYKFAGDYQANEIVSASETNDLDYTLQIYEFTKNKFIGNENGIVFVEDAFKLFCDKFDGVSKNDFSHYFKQFANDIFGAKKDRKRKAGFGNPLSCLTGVSFKEEGDYGL